MCEGAAGGPLSTAAWHICQIRGISPAHEAGIREDRGSHSSHKGRRSPSRKRSSPELVVIFQTCPLVLKKGECIANKLYVVHKSADETRLCPAVGLFEPAHGDWWLQRNGDAFLSFFTLFFAIQLT